MNILLSLLATVSISAQDMNKIVSAEVRAASAPAAIAELSKQVGYPLEAMASTKDDILVIKVTDVPLGTLLQKIASATNTEWEKTANGMRLIRTDPIRRKEANEEYAKLVEQIQASLDKTRKTVAEEGELTERNAQLVADRMVNMNERLQTGQPNTDWREEQKLANQSPAHRLLRNVTARLDAKTLASIPQDKRVVMSNQPNRMQVQLPANIQPYVQKFIKEQTIWAKAMKTARDRRGGGQRTVFYYSENAIDPSNRKVGKILLSLSRQSEARGVQATLVICDDKGRMLGTSNDSIGWDYEADYAQMQQAQKGDPSEPAMQFSGISKAMVQTFKSMYQSAMARSDSNEVDTPQEVRQVLIHPDKHEPLSFLLTDSIFEVARIRNLDIVCSAPDTLVYSMVTAAGDVKPSFFLASLAGTMQTESQDGWLTLKSQTPSASRRARLDRVLLAQYIGQTIKEGRVSLDNRANFAFKSGLIQETYLSTFTLTMAGLVKRNEQYGGDWDTLRLYGSLTAAQRQASRTSQPIPFRALQPTQLEILRRMVFDSPWSRLQINYEAEDFADTGTDGVFYGGGLDSEATEILPNGFTGTEMLTISDRTTPQFFGRPENDGQNQYMFGEGAYDVNSLAQQIFQEERPEMFPWLNQPGYPRGKVTKVRSGIQRQISMQAQFTRRASLHLHLTDKTYNGEAVAIDKLPADVKKQIQDALVKIREQYKDAKPPTWDYGGGGGGGNTPPPPEPPRQ